MNNTSTSDRIYIGFFGRRNTSKSSVLNAVTGQDLAVMSDVKETTTDPVYRAMELSPLGPVTMIDTPGISDEGQLGSLRMRKGYQVLNKTNVAVLVMNACHGPAPGDYVLLKKMGEKQVPCVAVCNKADVVGTAGGRPEGVPESVPVLSVSAHIGQGITTLKECLANLGKTQGISRKVVGDLLSSPDLAVLVVLTDKAAPRGHLILPQQQTTCDILEADTVFVVVRENGLRDMLASLDKKPRMVITDNRVFTGVGMDTPENILLTSSSTLFARHKGGLEPIVRGVRALDRVGKRDRILTCEGCTHYRQCKDAGTVKLPGWVREYIGTEPEPMFTSDIEFLGDLAGFRLTVRCGGCMLNECEMKYRIKCAHDQGVLITNYSMTIAYVRGISRRSVEPLPEIAALLCGSRGR